MQIDAADTAAQILYVGLAHADGTKASIIEGMNVFVAIIVSSLIFRMEKLTLRKIMGCVVGFAGVLLVNISGQSMDLSMTLTGEGFIFLSTVSYAFSSVILKLYPLCWYAPVFIL